MEYGAIAVALVGFCLGLRFRLKVLLPFLALLLIISAATVIVLGYSLTNALVTIVLGQFIIQGAYFAGLLARSLWSGSSRGTRLV